MNAKKTRNFILVTVLAMAAVLIVIFAGQAAQQNRLDQAAPPTKPNAANSPAPDLGLERRIDGDPLALGKVDAPVVMIEYSDYTCPYCSVHARKAQPEIVKKYVDAGLLRIEWRDLPVIGEHSVPAAVAGRAAAEQGKFWEFNETVYAAAPEKGKANLSDGELLKLAEKAGIPDLTKFTADMKSPALQAAVQKDLTEGTSLGINSTPTFVINNQAIPGAQPLEVFTPVIDAELAKKK